MNRNVGAATVFCVLCSLGIQRIFDKVSLRSQSQSKCMKMLSTVQTFVHLCIAN